MYMYMYRCVYICVYFCVIADTDDILTYLNKSMYLCLFLFVSISYVTLNSKHFHNFKDR